jgi:23S rRNA (cytidine2498-2'-O)-methyltransferase
VRIFLCSPGYEAAVGEELARIDRTGRPIAAGVVQDDGDDDALLDPVFARQQLRGCVAVRGSSVRALAEAAYPVVEGPIDAWPGPFSLHALTGADPPPGIGSRVDLIGRELLGLLAERRRRASRRYVAPEMAPGPSKTDRLLVQLLAVERDRVFVSASAPRPLPAGGTDLAPWPGGDAPVADDRGPPSRAYQKLLEAFAWMEAAPTAGERCVDLGASPGGWTAVALGRKARVTAVDRAPLAEPLRRDPRLTMELGNAFTYTPPAPVDWLLCDVIAEPQRSIALISRWLEEGLARNLVVTVKFKGETEYGRLSALPELFARVVPAFARVKQLAHNKNEVTAMVRRSGGGSGNNPP